MKKRIVFIFIYLLLLFNIFSDNIKVSEKNKQTEVTQTSNGTDLINIANPNGQGVSYNDFDSFNVGQNGVIFNNSKQTGTSQTGGIVEKNTNLNNTANLVIGEVTGKDISKINGIIEMFGAQADLIIANSNGIVVNGAGFINIPKAMLTTGKYDKITGKILAENGTVEISGNGIDVTKTNYFTILSRIIKLYGDIYGGTSEVNLIAGQNIYDTVNRSYESTISAIGGAPSFAIDSTNLGGIYAGKINIISSEKGVGVNSLGIIKASTGDFTLDSKGNIIINSVEAKKDVKISGESAKVTNIGAIGNTTIKVDETLETSTVNSGGNINIESSTYKNTKELVGAKVDINSKKIVNAGEIVAKDTLNVSSEELTLEKKSFLASTKGLTINSDKITTNEDSKIYSNDFVKITSTILNNFGLIKGAGIDLIIENIVNTGKIISIGDKGNISITSSSIDNSGNIAAQKNLNIKTLSLLNDKSGIIESGGDTTIYSDNLTNSGLFHSNGNINFYNNTTTESSITNYGTIEAIKSITFGKEDSKIGSIKNIGGKILAVENVNIYSENFENSPLKNIDIEYVNYSEDLALKSGVINVVNIGYYALGLLGEINLPISTEEIKKINEKLKTKYTEITEELKKKYPDKIFIVTGIEVGDYSEKKAVKIERILSIKDTYIDENFINKKYTSAVVSGKNVNIDATKLKNTGSTIVADQNINIKDTDNNIDVASINNDIKKTITLNKKEYTTLSDKDLKTIKFNVNSSVSFYYEEYEGPKGNKVLVKKDFAINGVSSQDSTLERESSIGSIVAGQDLKINNNSINNVGEATTENASSGSTADYDSTDLDSYEDNTKDILLNTQITGIQYLYETRLEYVDLSYYYGSEYFFNKIGFDPTKDGATILLGDSYYEVKYIISQLEKLIGNGYTSAQIASEIEQVKALFDNAAELKGTLGLVIGQTLTDEQKSKLTKDIVWLEQKEINGIKVLVPQVYLTTTTLKSISQGETEIYAGRNIEINGDKVNINGQISAGNKVLIKSKEIANSGGTIIGNAIGLYAEKDIVNTGETKIIAGETVVLDAKGNIKNTDGVISSGKDIGLYAGNDINLEGAYISAEGKVVLDAKNDVNIKTKVVTTKTENGENVHIVTKNESTYIEGENVLVSSGNDTNVIGSVISAEKNLSISAENDINILAAKDSVYDKTVKTKRRWGRKKKTTTETYDESIVSSQLSAGDSLIFNAKNDILIVGSTLENTEKEKKTTNEKGEEITEKYVDGNISLKAEGDIGVYEGRELHEYNQTVEKKGFSFSFDIKKFELKAGIKIEKYIINTLQDLALYSSFDGGNILAKGNNITLQGVKINADSDVTLIAENDLVISDATDKYSSYSKTETTFIGVTLAVNPDLANVGNYFDRLKDSTGLLGGNSSDIINGVFGVTSGLRDLAGTVNAVSDTSANGKEIQGNAGVTEVMKTDKEDVRNLVTASIGATYSTEESYSQSETVVASEIKGKNINIKSGKDTTIEGSTVEATKNVTIEAENLNVLASKSTSLNTSDSKTASVTVGLDNLHFDPTSVTMAYSQSDNYNYTETYTNSKIKAGESVNVKVNNDMTVKGGVIEGDTANIYVGNDLKIESLQDIEKGNSSSYSGSVTLSIAQGGLPTDISYNQSKSETDKAWVTEQSGIYTKNGGAIKVEGKTDLKGSVIASESEENKFALDTKEFSYENIEDH
ncbi:MAG: hemagglutinin repeat-containing protein, partial [Fusobacteriaceae bacterium]|nr:hemagglutinin repeat-containing protein [Fusobacteriaceae bacterium]